MIAEFPMPIDPGYQVSPNETLSVSRLDIGSGISRIFKPDRSGKRRDSGALNGDDDYGLSYKA